ncbi:MAG TPA: transcriptional regulator [Betaproteobacteria bacterium]|nr:transcriptional regulator [Betaproteobacteria bacterium]
MNGGYLTRAVALFWVMSWLPAVCYADMTPQAAGLNWLHRIATAAHRLNYTGIFVYQHGSHVEASRITHLLDASGEYEKLEALDGTPREIIRSNNQVFCYLPGKNAVIVEKRRTVKPFPALLPKQLSDLSANYAVKLGGVERVAGYDCRVIFLSPRDHYRYAHTLWAEAHSGLLLKANMRDGKNRLVDQFAFTQVTIGGPIDKAIFNPKPAAGAQVWKLPAAVNDQPAAGGGEWAITGLPPGFIKVLDVMRRMPGKRQPVRHIAYSDGLVAVSVFIAPENKHANLRQGLSRQGVINIDSRMLARHQVTVLGEVPVATIEKIAGSIAYEP